MPDMVTGWIVFQRPESGPEEVVAREGELCSACNVAKGGQFYPVAGILAVVVVPHFASAGSAVEDRDNRIHSERAGCATA